MYINHCLLHRRIQRHIYVSLMFTDLVQTGKQGCLSRKCRGTTTSY